MYSVGTPFTSKNPPVGSVAWSTVEPFPPDAGLAANAIAATTAARTANLFIVSPLCRRVSSIDLRIITFTLVSSPCSVARS
jgi:hypothetical protein